VGGLLRTKYDNDVARLRELVYVRCQLRRAVVCDAWPPERFNTILVWRNRSPATHVRDPFEPGVGLLPVDYWTNHNLHS